MMSHRTNLQMPYIFVSYLLYYNGLGFYRQCLLTPLSLGFESVIMVPI